jgi:nitroreductase
MLLQIVDAARLAPSAFNVQPCEFILVTRPRKLSETYDCVDWDRAAFPKGRPPAGQRPVSYLVVLVDLIKRRKGGCCDAAAATENAFLAAVEQGLGCCWIRDFNRKKLKGSLRIPHHLAVESILAMGYPDEDPVLDESADSVKPFEDPDGTVHVPKRRLADVCTMNGYRHSVHDSRKPV